MRRIQFVAAFFACLLLFSAVKIIASPPSFGRSLFGTAPTVKWHNELPAAHRQALAENKPLLLVFGAEWCGFCTKLDKQTLRSKEVAQLISEDFVPVHLDLDKEKRVGEILEVSSLPCSIVLSPNADLLARINGFEQAPSFHRKLSEASRLYRSQNGTPISAPGTVLR